MTLLPKNNPVILLPCKGIGDALLMLIGAQTLLTQGYHVTTVHPKLPEIASWFPDHQLAAEIALSTESFVIAENDNSDRIQKLKRERRENLSIFYPTYSKTKHGPLHALDRAFNPQVPMAHNIADAAGSLCGVYPSRDNGIRPPAHLTHRKYPKRVLLHHTSSTEEKNWPLENFEQLAQRLKKEGFEPCLIPSFPTLAELFAFVYESGFVIGNDSLVGHLASNLQIPTVVIGDNRERLNLWRPGWLEGEIVTLSYWLPKWKLVEKNWKKLVRPQKVLRAFQKINKN